MLFSPLPLTPLANPIDLVILSNGPGELMTWVRPVLKALRAQWGDDRDWLRISLVLAPCIHASGQETKIAQTYTEVDRVQGPNYFWPFLLWGQTADTWDWREQGVVLFLGGDQFFAVVMGKQLGYQVVTYAEWSARWLPWVDRCGLRHPQLLQHIPPRHRHKVTVVGDLMATAQDYEPDPPVSPSLRLTPNTDLIGLLPGSKPAKLALGVPLMLAIAEHIQTLRPQTRFIIPVAPSVEIATLATYADAQQNPTLEVMDGTTATLVKSSQGLPCLLTAEGLQIELWTQTPPYSMLRHCHLCLTTVGANTAELAALAIPMVVLLPTQKLDAMRAWDGIPGILANLPLVGKGFAVGFNWLILKRGLGLRAWPNLWAEREIVPELVGHLHPPTVAQEVVDLLHTPNALAQMSQNLRQVRGRSGADKRMVNLVQEALRINEPQRRTHEDLGP